MKTIQTDVARLFHVHSCHERSRTPELDLDWDERPTHARTYPGAPRTPLPGRDFDLSAPIGEVLERRRSVRDYELRPMPLVKLGRLLHASHGVKGERVDGERVHTRPAPSAGGLYPVEVYVATQSVEGLADGVYHYDPRTHELALRRSGLAQPSIARMALDQTMVLGSSVVVMLTAIPERTMWKYGQRGYRYVWLDAGHLGQTLYLVATALGLGPVGIGGFYDREMDALLALPDGEHTVYLLCIGQPAPEKKEASR